LDSKDRGIRNHLEYYKPLVQVFLLLFIPTLMKFQSQFLFLYHHNLI